MNVLYIANSIELYGANTSLLDMIESMRGEGFYPVVLAAGPGDLTKELFRRKIKYYIIPYYTNCDIAGRGLLGRFDKLFANMMLLSRASEIIKKHRIDIIHTNASNIDFGAMLAIKEQLPHVWHIREMLYEHYKFRYDVPFLSHYLLHRADKIIAISKYVKDGKHLEKNAAVLYNGFHVEKYNICKGKLFSEAVCNILYCGMISEGKGVMDVVKAVDCLIRNGYQNISLSIVGDGTAYWKKVKDFIEVNHLEPYIKYYGYQQNLKPFREMADIAVVSSRYEALGRVTIESMLGEVLVIGADSGATTELICDGVTGYLYEVGNSRQLADQIISVLENKNKSREIVYQAKKYALENFDSSQYAAQILKIYKQCLTGK